MSYDENKLTSFFTTTGTKGHKSRNNVLLMWSFVSFVVVK